jgi:hypothetical protein
MTARIIRRGLVAGAAAVLVVTAAVVTRSAGSTCSLDQVTAASAASDTIQAVAPWGDGVLAVGSRFTGSTSGALEAIVTADGTYDARMLDIFDRHIVQLDDLAVIGDQAWAVGAVTNTEPVAAHFDGSAWSAMPIADPGPNEDGLAGIAVVSPSQIWAVGRHQIDEDFVTLIERSDGRTWRVVPSPNTGSSAMLQDVVAVGPNDVWAVGWSVTEKGYRSLAEHWNGSAWTIVPTPAAGVDSLLTAVAATGPNDVWAVGRTGRGDATRPLVERWDGSRWTVVPPPETGSAILLSVSATSQGIAVAGRRSDGQTEPQPVAALRVGDTWADITMSIAGAAWLNDIGSDASGRLWGVGTAFPLNATLSGLVVQGCPPT